MRRIFPLCILLVTLLASAARAAECPRTHPRISPTWISTDTRVERILAEVIVKTNRNLVVSVCEHAEIGSPNVSERPCTIFLPQRFKGDISDTALKGALAHEVGHCVLPIRRSFFSFATREREEMQVDALAATWVGTEVMIEALQAIPPHVAKITPRDHAQVSRQIERRIRALLAK